MLGCGMFGFGVGGITFLNRNAKGINQEFGKFKIESENEIKQKDNAKDKYVLKAQEMIKENTELHKINNNSLRNIELLQSQLVMALQKLDFYVGGGPEKLVMQVEKEKVKKNKLIEKAEIKVMQQEKLIAKEEKAKLKVLDIKNKKDIKEKAKIEKDNNIKIAAELKAAAAELKAKIKAKSNLKGELLK